MDKYDEAIAFLKGVNPGSYFDECAALMEELLAQVEAQLEAERCEQFQPSQEHIDNLKQTEAAARSYAKLRGLL